jgi:hypothetical protein
MNLSQSAPNTQSSRSSGAGLGVSQWQTANTAASPPPFANNAATPANHTAFAEFQNGATYPTDTNFAGNDDPPSPYSAQPANYRGQGPDNGMALNPADDNDFPFPDARGGQRGGAISPAGATSRQERLPAPMPGAPVGSSPNPNVRTTPTVEGQRLALGPNETAADRAVMLAQVLETAQAEAAGLRDRVRYLEQQQQVLERARADGAQVADQAASEMARARTQMEALHVEVVQLRERLRRLDRQDLDTLREVIDGLEGLLHEDNSKKQ